VEETIEILRGIKERYEEHQTHDSRRRPEGGGRARLQVRGRPLPADKAIDLVDDSLEGAHQEVLHAAIAEGSRCAGWKVCDREGPAISSQQYEMAAELRDREIKLQDKIEKMERAGSPTRGTPAHWTEKIARGCQNVDGHPAARIASEESARLRR